MTDNLQRRLKLKKNPTRFDFRGQPKYMQSFRKILTLNARLSFHLIGLHLYWANILNFVFLAIRFTFL